MPNVGLHRANADRTPIAAPTLANHLRETLDLDLVADNGRRSMALVEIHVDRIDSGLCIGSLERELLAAWIGGSDALALSVARRTDAADDRVHSIAIPTRVAQALEDHDACAFAHDEAVRALIKRC